MYYFVDIRKHSPYLLLNGYNCSLLLFPTMHLMLLHIYLSIPVLLLSAGDLFPNICTSLYFSVHAIYTCSIPISV